MTEQYPQYQPPAPPQQDWIRQQVPPPPEPPRKKGSKGRNILIALVAILGLIVIVNIYNNIASVKTASPSVAHVAPAVTPEPSEPAVEEEPADTGSDMESDPHFLTYAQVTSAFEQAGFSLVVFHDSVEKGSCFDGAGSSDETIAFVVFKCQYEDMPIVLPEFENSINENTDFHYKVEDANWIVYFTSDTIAYQFASGYPGSQVEDL